MHACRVSERACGEGGGERERERVRRCVRTFGQSDAVLHTVLPAGDHVAPKQVLHWPVAPK